MTNAIIMAGQVAGALSAIGAVVFVIVKYVVVKPIQNYIDKATYPISPTSNGGKSLPDAIRGIKRIEAKLEKMDQRVQVLEDTLKVPQIQYLSVTPATFCITGKGQELPNITDPEIWDKLSIQAKTKWLAIQADLADARCGSCYQIVCTCGEDY